MNKKLARTYRRFRDSGAPASHALSMAKTLIEFSDLADAGKVRVRAEEEVENYFDVFGDPEGYTDCHGRRVSAEQAKKDQQDIIERLGCWCSISEYLGPDGEWEHADSCGMHTGYQNPLCPFENWYIPDLMREAIRQCEDAWDDAAVAI